MGRIGRTMAAGTLAVGLVGGVAVAWTNPQEPPKLEEVPAIGDVKREVIGRVAVDEPRDEPALRLTWAAPTEARVNRAAPYCLTVTNTGTQAVQKVVVQVRVPNGATASDAEPAACLAAGVVLWELGTMQPREEKQLKLRLASPARGELTPRAWVTFTGSSAVNVPVREPKLVVSLAAPETVAIGEEFHVNYKLRNEGDCAAKRVLMSKEAPREFAVRGTDGTDVMPDLAPGRSIDGEFVHRATASGVYTYTVTSSCADGQKVTATARVKVLAPKLEVKIEGPSEVGIMRAARFVATVTNTGDLAAEDVGVRFDPSAGIAPPSATITALYSTVASDPLATAVGTLKPGETKSFAFGGTAAKPGDYVTKFSVSGKRGVGATAECRTTVRGVPGIRMELVDSVDPVKKGEDAVYEIRVSNTGTDTDRNLRLHCELPAGMTLVSASGPVEYATRTGAEVMDAAGRRVPSTAVTFAAVPELGPKAEVAFKVKVRTGSIGDARFKATITSDHLTTPVTKEESTTVYGD